MNWKTVALKETRAAPWKNGGGITHELTAWPAADDWVWRMSVAHVAHSGPFSKFEGIDRWFAVLDGEGVALSIGGQRRKLTASSKAFQFDGGADTGCDLLAGPTQDFNLMTRRSQANSTLTRVTGPCTLNLFASETIAIYSINTGAIVHFDSQSLNLPAHSLAWRVASHAGECVVDSANALVARIVWVANTAAASSARNPLEPA